MSSGNGQADQFGRVPADPIFDGAAGKMSLAAARVYIVLAAHARADWTARPSLKRIAELADLTPQGAIGGIKALENAGLLTVRRAGKGGRARVNVYQINSQPGLSVSKGETVNGGARKQSTAGPETVNETGRNSQPPLTRTDRTERTEHATEGDAAAAVSPGGGEPDSIREVRAALNAVGVRGTNAGRCAVRLLEIGTTAAVCRWVKQRRREIGNSATSAAAVLVAEIIGKNRMTDEGLRIVLEEAADDGGCTFEAVDSEPDDPARLRLFNYTPEAQRIIGRLRDIGWGDPERRCDAGAHETQRFADALAAMDEAIRGGTVVKDRAKYLDGILTNPKVRALAKKVGKGCGADFGPRPNEQKKKMLSDALKASGVTLHRKPDPNHKPLDEAGTAAERDRQIADALKGSVGNGP